MPLETCRNRMVDIFLMTWLWSTWNMLQLYVTNSDEWDYILSYLAEKDFYNVTEITSSSKKIQRFPHWHMTLCSYIWFIYGRIKLIVLLKGSAHARFITCISFSKSRKQFYFYSFSFFFFFKKMVQISLKFKLRCCSSWTTQEMDIT